GTSRVHALEPTQESQVPYAQACPTLAAPQVRACSFRSWGTVPWRDGQGPSRVLPQLSPADSRMVDRSRHDKGARAPRARLTTRRECCRKKRWARARLEALCLSGLSQAPPDRGWRASQLQRERRGQTSVEPH